MKLPVDSVSFCINQAIIVSSANQATIVLIFPRNWKNCTIGIKKRVLYHLILVIEPNVSFAFTASSEPKVSFALAASRPPNVSFALAASRPPNVSFALVASSEANSNVVFGTIDGNSNSGSSANVTGTTMDRTKRNAKTIITALNFIILLLFNAINTLV